MSQTPEEVLSVPDEASASCEVGDAVRSIWNVIRDSVFRIASCNASNLTCASDAYRSNFLWQAGQVSTCSDSTLISILTPQFAQVRFEALHDAIRKTEGRE